MKLVVLLPVIAVFLSACSTMDKAEGTQQPAVEIKNSAYLDSSFEVENKKKPGDPDIKSTENVWTVAPESTLKRVLEVWAERAQWSVSYETLVVVELYNKKPVALYADSIDVAAVELSKNLNLKAQGLFVVPYSGNKVIRVFTKGVK